MDKIEDLRIFQRVAELNSFTRAAEGLGLPKAKVSHSIAKLEESLNAQLFHRSMRKVQLTHDGTTLYERLRDLLSDIDEIETMFIRGEKDVTGRLRIDVPQSVGVRLLIPRLPEFLKLYPKIELEISSTDRQVDVIREGFDCVVRVGSRVDPDLISKRLGYLKISNTASRGYLKKFGRPKTIEDLDRHRLIAYAPHFGPKPDGFEYFEDGTYKLKAMPSQITVNSSDAYLAAALAGLGIIQSPTVGVKKLIAEGVLEEVLKEYKAEPMPVTLLFPHRRNLALRSRLFMNWLETILKDYMD